MRADLGQIHTLLASISSDNGAPSGDAGLDMTTIDDHRVTKWALTVKLTGTGQISADLFLWARDRNDDWGQVGNASGQLNDAATVEGDTARTFRAILHDVGIWPRLYLEVQNLTGTGAAIEAWIAPVFETPRGD